MTSFSPGLGATNPTILVMNGTTLKGKKKISPCPKYDHIYLHLTLDGYFLIASLNSLS